MAYDEDLADRIRALVAKERGLSEKKMFGGLAFLVGGNMAVAASGQGGILVRVDPDQSDQARRDDEGVGRRHARQADVRLAAGRGRRRADETATGEMGDARHHLRPVAAGQAVRRTSRSVAPVRPARGRTMPS